MYTAKKKGSASNTFNFKKIFPWFILYFVGASIVTTVVGLMGASSFTTYYSDYFVVAMKWLAKFFIAMAMCGIGLNTDIVSLVKKGGKPILMGITCWVAITLVSLGIQLLTGIYYTSL